MQHRTEKMLSGMEKNEQTLQSHIQSSDSAKIRQFFAASEERYQQLKGQLQAPVNNPPIGPIKQYVPNLDSIQTAFRFLTQPSAGSISLSAEKLRQIQAVSQQIGAAESRLQQADQIQQFLKTREQQLQSQLSSYNVGSQLQGINKQAYYAQQQVAEYKAMIGDRQKMEEKVLTTLENVPAFQPFMQKYSFLGQAFGLPGNYGETTALNGMQTRTQVQQLIGQLVGSGTNNGANGDPAAYISNQVQAAQGYMSQLKDKLNMLGGSAGSADMTMPASAPNSQKTRTFLKRLIYGADIQTQPSSTLLPAMLNLALTLGYKLTDNVTAGVGAGYQVGVGSSWDHIAFSSQGVSMRSYFDARMKGSWWIAGGLEYKYLQGFKGLSILHRLDLWQQSALIGLEKKYKIKNNKEGKIELLFDALYRQHVPSSQPLIFRTGLNF